MPRSDGRYEVVFTKGVTEYLEADGIKIEGGWITFYQDSQAHMTVSCAAVERIEHPTQPDLEPFIIH